jgi:hypothetical protein
MRRSQVPNSRSNFLIKPRKTRHFAVLWLDELVTGCWSLLADEYAVAEGIDALRVSEHARRIGRGVDDIVGQRSAGRIQFRQIAHALRDLVIGTGGVAADAEPADDLVVPVQRQATAEEDQAARNLIPVAAAARRQEEVCVEKTRLALAIAWLPGQTCVGSSVDVVYAQISPARLTTAAHMRVPLNRPPADPPAAGAAARTAFSSCAVGKSRQENPRSGDASARGMTRSPNIAYAHNIPTITSPDPHRLVIGNSL